MTERTIDDVIAWAEGLAFEAGTQLSARTYR